MNFNLQHFKLIIIFKTTWCIWLLLKLAVSMDMSLFLLKLAAFDKNTSDTSAYNGRKKVVYESYC